MPNLVGSGLTQAFKTLDAHPKIDVEDIGGQHRPVTWPANWKVCQQSPAPDASLTENTSVSLGVVKKTEECPK